MSPEHLERAQQDLTVIAEAQLFLEQLIHPSRNGPAVWTHGRREALRGSIAALLDVTRRIRETQATVWPELQPGFEASLAATLGGLDAWPPGETVPPLLIAAARACRDCMAERPLPDDAASADLTSGGLREALVRLCVLPSELSELQGLIGFVDCCANMPQRSWSTCNNGSWLPWIAIALGCDVRLVVMCVADCVRAAVAATFDDEPDHVQRLVELAERWAKGECSADDCMAATQRDQQIVASESFSDRPSVAGAMAGASADVSPTYPEIAAAYAGRAARTLCGLAAIAGQVTEDVSGGHARASGRPARVDVAMRAQTAVRFAAMARAYASVDVLAVKLRTCTGPHAIATAAVEAQLRRLATVVRQRIPFDCLTATQARTAELLVAPAAVPEMPPFPTTSVWEIVSLIDHAGEFTEWARFFGSDLRAAWHYCPRADWAIWQLVLFVHDRRVAVASATDLVRTAVTVSCGQDAAAFAGIEAVETWLKGAISIAECQMRVAAATESLATVPIDARLAATGAGTLLGDPAGAVLCAVAAHVARQVDARMAYVNGSTSYGDIHRLVGACAATFDAVQLDFARRVRQQVPAEALRWHPGG